MKKFLSLFLILTTLLTSLSLFGCGGDTSDFPETPVEPDVPDEPDTPEVPDVPDEPSAPSVPYINEENLARLVEPTTDLVDDEAYKRATQYNRRANVTLLQSVMNRAKAGESITVATIGGSITQGTAASNSQTKSYSARFRNWWSLTFPESYVTWVNAGIGATTSYLGVHRVQEDVIDKGADVCIVEFSVNDYTDSYYKLTYESLIARLLDNDVAVILLFMVKQTGDSTQTNNVSAGMEMEVPMISYGDAVMPMIEAGELAWEDISPDTIHPNDKGHSIASELIWEYLNEVFVTCPDEVEPSHVRDEILTQTRYFNSYLLDNTTLEPTAIEGFTPTSKAYSTYTHGWSTTDGGVIEFTATFKCMGAMYIKQTNGKAGKCDIYIDGEKVATLDGDYTGGWGDYSRTDQFFTSRVAAKEHTVRLVAEEGKEFTIVQFLVAE